MRKTLALAALVLTTTSPAYAGQCGRASHYGVGDGYGGLRTASGAIMRPWEMTTASPHLPMGARLRVTNQDNGRSVIVKVNDRGPYYGGRILDLSHGAFSQIAHPGSGTARVCYTRLV